MKITLPSRNNIKETGAADPLKFYYFPVASAFYKARFADAVRLLGGEVKNLLDVGCGSGIFLPELSKHCRQLFACDFHRNLNKTKRMLRAENLKVELVRTDARVLPFADESMDAIVCMSVLEHLHDLQSPAEEFYRVLKPGGTAVIGVPVENFMTDVMLRLSYLTLPNASLDDEHVSTHRDVLKTFSQLFKFEKGLNIPRGLPEQMRMYRTVCFKKSP